MIDAHRDRIQGLFADAVKLTRAERGPFLDRCSEGDPALRAIVEALIDAHEESPLTPSIAATLSPSTSHDPECIGPYRISRKIGEGGMGTVYLAEQTDPIRRTVALKVIKRGMDTDEVLARFEGERQSLALMNHPGIAQVHDAGATADGRPYFVMEYVAGLPVTDYCDRRELTVADRIELFLEICAAVQHAHQKGIIHRDLKPSNILVTTHTGEVLPKIIDFGLAKSTELRLTERTVATRLGQIMGTPGYISPEQMDIAATDIDTRSDVYSLGVILYELLVGVLPFDPESLHAAGYVEVQRIIREVEPPRPSTRFSMRNGASDATARARGTDARALARQLRGDLDWIAMRCLEKDRALRYASASELAADLERHLHDEPVLAGPPSRAYRLRKFVRKNRGLVTAAALVFVALTAGLAVASYGLVKANHHREVAEGALRETKAAGDAEAERAAQLQQVADFQGEQLAALDVPLMGTRLRKGLLDSVRAASERGRHAEEETTARVAEVEKLIADANFTDIALASLNDNIFTRTLETIDRQFAEQPTVQVQLVETLGKTLFTLGLLDAELAAWEKAVDIHRRQHGDEDLKTMAVVHRLGNALLRQGRLSEAEPHLRTALDAHRRVLGDEDPNTLVCFMGLVLLLQRQGKFVEGELLCRQAVDAHRRVLGNESLHTLVAIGNLGNLLMPQGKLVEAEACFREALDTFRRVLGNEHTSTLIAMNDMASVLSSQGRFAEAEPYYREALETSRRIRGSGHPSTIGLIGNLGAHLANQGRLAEAAPLVRETVESNRRLLGNEHSDTLNAVANMGGLLFKQGRLAEAEVYSREALDGYRRVLGAEHVSTLGAINNLAVILTSQGKIADAELCLRDALEITRRVHGEEHPETLEILGKLGRLLMDQGRHVEAEPYLRETMELRRRVLGSEHIDTLLATATLGTLLMTLGKLTEAEPCLKEALEGYRRVLGNEHAHTLIALTNMGALLVRQGKLAEAEACLRVAWEASRRVLGTREASTRSAVNYLMEALRSLGKLEEAEALARELLVDARESGGDALGIGVALKRHGQTLVALKRYAEAAQELEEAHALFLEREGAAYKGNHALATQIAECYEARHAAEPGAGHDAKATEWRTKLKALDAGKQDQGH